MDERASKPPGLLPLSREDLEKTLRYALEIVSDGTGKSFTHEHNTRWLEVTRPIVEAFLHARFFLEMGLLSVRSG